MKNHARCPNCGRNLTEDEIYCYFCETDLSELEEKSKKHQAKNKNKN